MHTGRLAALLLVESDRCFTLRLIVTPTDASRENGGK